jgi:hypothetical protein
MARLAVDLVSGPAGVAAVLRQNLLTHPPARLAADPPPRRQHRSQKPRRQTDPLQPRPTRPACGLAAWSGAL